MAATEKEIRLTVDCSGTVKNLLWISLQRDGSISVGFIDQRVVISAFTSEQELDGVIQREHVDLTCKHRPEALEDPHFTLHDGAYFQLRSRKETPLLRGLVWTTPEPGYAMSPWLRFVSSPIKDLRRTRRVRKSMHVEIYRLFAKHEDCSIAVHLDFVRPDQRPVIIEGNKISHVIAWKAVTLSVLAYEVPHQPATLGYLIRG